MLPFSSSSELIEYQLLSNTDIPQSVWDDTKVYKDADNSEHWHYTLFGISGVKGLVDFLS